MSVPDAGVRRFFDEFERTGNDPDPLVTAEQFTATFLAADPNGIRPVPREAFIAALPQRRRLFESAGIGRVRLTTIDQTDLDDHHVLVRTEWRADAGAGIDPLELASTFLLRRDGGQLRIAVYLNAGDILATLAARRAAMPAGG